jgi:hypothetical protein
MAEPIKLKLKYVRNDRKLTGKEIIINPSEIRIAKDPNLKWVRAYARDINSGIEYVVATRIKKSKKFVANYTNVNIDDDYYKSNVKTVLSIANDLGFHSNDPDMFTTTDQHDKVDDKIRYLTKTETVNTYGDEFDWLDNLTIIVLFVMFAWMLGKNDIPHIITREIKIK